MRQQLEPSLRKELNIEIIRDLAKRGKRIDGRQLNEMREIRIISMSNKVESPIFTTYLGNTIVTVGIKLTRMVPYSDAPDEGGLMVNLDFSPGSNEEIVPGPPCLQSILASRLIDRGLREGANINFSQLYLQPGEAFQVNVDAVCLNDDGNIEDAGFLATREALKHVNIWDKQLEGTASEAPLLEYQNDIVSVSFVKIENSLLVDPTLDEQFAADSQLTLLIDPSKELVVGSQLYSPRYPMQFTFENLQTCIELAVEISKKLITQKLVKNVC